MAGKRSVRTMIKRTLLNWRWWILLPVIVALIPIAALAGLGGWVDERLAPFTNKLMRWMRRA